jgi:hypothetical protein
MTGFGRHDFNWQFRDAEDPSGKKKGDSEKKVKENIFYQKAFQNVPELFLSRAAPLRKYSSAESGPLPFIAKRTSKIKTMIVRINSKLLPSMFLLFTKMMATITMGI